MKGKPRLEVDGNFAGGNIVIDKIRGEHAFVHPDLRDTGGFWFYWCFRARGAGGHEIKVTFTSKAVFGPRGPAASMDGGKTWFWLGMTSTRRKSFKCLVPASTDDARFCFSIPYTGETLHGFLERHRANPALSTGKLCTTAKGRDVEEISLGKTTGTSSYKILLVARHHACETMASYVVEGFIEHVLDSHADGAWFREHADIKCIPFVDKDGVEDGDQGKNRVPRDHNRDYDDHSLYHAVRAIKDNVPSWLGGLPAIALDLHCPYIHDEKIQLIGLADDCQWRALLAFSTELERSRRGALPFHVADNMPFGKAWNTPANTRGGLDFSSWVWPLPGMLLAATIEIPYATASGVEVTAMTARSFGHDLARATRLFLERGSPGLG